MLSSQLLASPPSELYSKDQRHRIEGVLIHSEAASLYTALSSQIEYETAFVSNGDNYSIPFAEWKKLSTQQPDVVNHIYQQASRGVGYIYGKRKVDESSSNEALRKFYLWLNSEEAIEWIKKLTGHDDIASVSYTHLTLPTIYSV